jgi:hypothetical protein
MECHEWSAMQQFDGITKVGAGKRNIQTQKTNAKLPTTCAYQHGITNGPVVFAHSPADLI